MPWAKIHTDILNDPKLMRAAAAGCKGLEFTPWLIVFAKLADDDGRLSIGGTRALPAELARGIPGASAGKLTACESSLISIGVLSEDTDGVLYFTRYRVRQGKPSDQPERVRERVTRHRKRPVVTPSRGVTVTPRKADTVTPTEETEETEERGTPFRGQENSTQPGPTPIGNALSLVRAELEERAHG